jgi:hypothetical protein
VIVDVGFLGVVALLLLPAVVVAMGQWSVIVDVGVPGGSVLEVVSQAPLVMVTDMPVVVAMLGRGVGMLGFLPLALGTLPDIGHRGPSFRIADCLDYPAWHVPIDRGPGRPFDGTTSATSNLCDEQARGDP